MGAVSDPMSVTDPAGRVIGLDGLFVADASLIPEIPSHNLNVPVMMIGERMAELIGARRVMPTSFQRAPALWQLQAEPRAFPCRSSKTIGIAQPRQTSTTIYSFSSMTGNVSAL